MISWKNPDLDDHELQLDDYRTLEMQDRRGNLAGEDMVLARLRLTHERSAGRFCRYIMGWASGTAAL